VPGVPSPSLNQLNPNPVPGLPGDTTTPITPGVPGGPSPLNNQLNTPTTPGAPQNPVNPSSFPPVTPPLNPTSSPGTIPQAPRQTKPGVSSKAPQETEYTVGAGDVVRVDVFLVPEYSGQYQVLVDGTITLPLVGKTQVEGLTLTELSNVLSEKYTQYLKKPIITVGLISPRPLRIAMSGEVNRPGTYTINLQAGQSFPSVTDLIQLSGGLTTAANIREVEITRRVNGKEILTRVNLLELIQQGNIGQDISLRDGDRVAIPTALAYDPQETRTLAQASFGIRLDQPVNIVVVGEVYRPGSYQIIPNQQLQQLIPILPRLTGGIQQAGGIKPSADIRSVQLRRLTRSGEEKVIDVNLWDLLQSGNTDQDLILQDGDTIIVPKAVAVDPKEADTLASSSFSPASIRVNVVGEVKKPGPVDVPSNTPLNQGILAAGGFVETRSDQGSVELIRLNPDGTVSKRQLPVDLAKGIDEENNPGLRNNDVIVVSPNGFANFTDGLGAALDPFRNIFPFIGLFR